MQTQFNGFMEDPWMDDMGITQHDMIQGRGDAIREKEIKAEEEKIAAEIKAKHDPLIQRLIDTDVSASRFNRQLNEIEKISAMSGFNVHAGLDTMETGLGSKSFENVARQWLPQQKVESEKAIVEALLGGVSFKDIANIGLKHMANGGISQGGLTVVGERGPELVSLPGGSRVYPNGSGPGGGMTFHFHGAVYGVDDLQRVVVEAVRDHAISGGFAGVFAEA